MEEKEHIMEDSPPKGRHRIGVLSLFVSIILHASLLVPAFIGGFTNLDMKVDWLESYNDLQGLSTENKGRWAKIEIQSDSEKEKVEEVEEEEVEVEEEIPEPPKVEVVEKKKHVPSKNLTKTKKKKKKKKISAKKKVEAPEDYVFDKSGPNGIPNISGFGPGNVVYSAMIRTDRIRNSRFETSLSELFQSIPDYRIALQNTTIDPIRNIDMLYIASANPRSLPATFLAMKHKMTHGLIMRKLDRRFQESPPWTKYRNKPIRDLVPENDAYPDSRKILLAKNGLALVGKEKWFRRLYKPSSEGSKSSMMQTLSKIQNASENSKMLILVSARKVRLPIPGLGRQVFENVKLEVSDIKHPKVLVELAFADEKSASRFADNCEKTKVEIIRKMGFLSFSLGGFVRALHCESESQFVSIRATYTQDEVLRLLKLVKLAIPRPKFLEELPPSPPLSELRKKPTTTTNNAPVEKGIAPGLGTNNSKSKIGITNQKTTNNKKTSEKKTNNRTNARMKVHGSSPLSKSKEPKEGLKNLLKPASKKEPKKVLEKEK